MTIFEYLDAAGASPFKAWFDGLDLQAAARISRILTRMEQGNLADVKRVGEGVLEKRIDFGPGYRLYFGRDGEALIILLAGGTKRRQQDDIRSAQTCWADYKKRKRDGDRGRTDP